MNNISKKNNLSLHGYFMASGIESLYLIMTTNENITYYNTLSNASNTQKCQRLYRDDSNIKLSVRFLTADAISPIVKNASASTIE